MRPDVLVIEEGTVLVEQADDTVVHVEVERLELLELVAEEVTVLVEQCDESILQEQTKLVEVLAVAEQGPAGPPGMPGPAGGQVLQRRAGMTLSALTVVYEDRFGDVWPADHDVPGDVFTLLGITLTAAEQKQPVNVQRLGHVDDDGWRWVPGDRIYLGRQGRLLPMAPANGFDVLIGTALSPTRLLLNIQDPIELE